MSWGRASLCLCIGVLIIGGTASGGEDVGGAERAEMVLFSSEPMDATTGIKVTEYYVADDFQVSANANATSVSFKLGDWNGDFSSVFDGLIRWWIHLDIGVRAMTDHASTDDHDPGVAFPSNAEQRLGGEPGPLLARGTAYDVGYSVTTPPGPSVYTTCYHVNFNLGQQVSLTTGTRYWLVLNVNQGLASEELYSWIKSESDSFAPACFSDGTPGCTPSTIDLTFSLTANTEVHYLFADGFETGDTTIWSSSMP